MGHRCTQIKRHEVSFFALSVCICAPSVANQFLFLSVSIGAPSVANPPFLSAFICVHLRSSAAQLLLAAFHTSTSAIAFAGWAAMSSSRVYSAPHSGQRVDFRPVRL